MYSEKNMPRSSIISKNQAKKALLRWIVISIAFGLGGFFIDWFIVNRLIEFNQSLAQSITGLFAFVHAALLVPITNEAGRRWSKTAEAGEKAENDEAAKADFLSATTPIPQQLIALMYGSGIAVNASFLCYSYASALEALLTFVFVSIGLNFLWLMIQDYSEPYFGIICVGGPEAWLMEAAQKMKL
jgi:hypothetical protein